MSDREKVKCPYCGQQQSTNTYKQDAVVTGVWAKCKNPQCRKEYEIHIFRGKQFK